MQTDVIVSEANYLTDYAMQRREMLPIVSMTMDVQRIYPVAQQCKPLS
jgi:hypothetical protein